jgi:hypothetical protein
MNLFMSYQIFLGVLAKSGTILRQLLSIEVIQYPLETAPWCILCTFARALCHLQRGCQYPLSNFQKEGFELTLYMLPEGIG